MCRANTVRTESIQAAKSDKRRCTNDTSKREPSRTERTLTGRKSRTEKNERHRVDSGSRGERKQHVGAGECDRIQFGLLPSNRNRTKVFALGPIRRKCDFRTAGSASG